MADRRSSLSKLGLPAKLAVGAVVMVIPLAAYFLIFHSEIQTEIEAAQVTNRDLEQKLSEARKAEAAYLKDVQELTERERNKRELLKVLPATTEYPAFLSAIQNVSNLVGVELRSWTPQPEVPEEFYVRTPMLLEINGRFHQVAKFLYNVGQLERIINMENIALKAIREDESPEVALEVKVLATAFHAVSDDIDESGPKARDRRDRK